jgi:hypothetical protein
MRLIGGVRGDDNKFASFVLTVERSEFMALAETLCLDGAKTDRALCHANEAFSSSDIWTKCNELHRMDTQLADAVKKLTDAKQEIVNAFDLVVKVKGVRTEQKKQKQEVE